jgi:hypothetical protein
MQVFIINKLPVFLFILLKDDHILFVFEKVIEIETCKEICYTNHLHIHVF